MRRRAFIAATLALATTSLDALSSSKARAIICERRRLRDEVGDCSRALNLFSGGARCPKASHFH